MEVVGEAPAEVLAFTPSWPKTLKRKSKLRWAKVEQQEKALKLKNPEKPEETALKASSVIIYKPLVEKVVAGEKPRKAAREENPVPTACSLGTRARREEPSPPQALPRKVPPAEEAEVAEEDALPPSVSLEGKGEPPTLRHLLKPKVVPQKVDPAVRAAKE